MIFKIITTIYVFMNNLCCKYINYKIKQLNMPFEFTYFGNLKEKELTAEIPEKVWAEETLTFTSLSELEIKLGKIFPGYSILVKRKGY